MKIPHTFVIVAFILLICGLLTWIIPSGEFDRTKVDVDGITREVIVADSYHPVEPNHQTWQIIGSVVDGFKKQSAIIVFILIIGGAFQLLASTKAIDFGIYSFVNNTAKYEKNRLIKKIGIDRFVIVSTMLIFSLFGAVFGMSEETIAFVIIFIPLAISMGYDSITGILMVYVAAHIGFSGAMFNPFTIGIAQGLSGLPIFSGFEYRALVWLILTALIIVITLRYSHKIKKNPHLSPTYSIDTKWRTNVENATTNLTNSNANVWTYCAFVISSIILIISSIYYPTISIKLGNSSASFVCLPLITFLYIISSFFAIRKGVLSYILNILVFTIVILIVGVLGFGWYIAEISTLFLSMGILSAIAVGFGGNKIATEFLAGAKDILSAALIVGLAGGIIEILTNGKILDTILYSLSGNIQSGRAGTLSIMYGIQTVINLFIPSGSAKAALTMPIMAPFSDIVGLSRQAMVMAFQLGDGFTNMITPTSGVLMGVLGAAKVPYSLWVKWFWKILLIFILVGLLLLLPTIIWQFPGF